MWVDKNGPTWRIRDKVGGKIVTIKSGYGNKTLAKNAMKEKSADKLRGESLVPRGGELTLSGWIDMWWPSYSVALKASSRVSTFGIVNRYIKPMIGDVSLEEIAANPMIVQKWVAALLAGETKVKQPKRLSQKTVANAHGCLHKIMGEAVGQRRISANPCERTRLPQKTHYEMQFLSEPEAGRLLAAVPEYWGPLILLLLGTGLRWGEGVGLLVRDVDVLGGKLHVRRNLHELADTAEMVEQAPKTAASRRTVTFTRDLAEALIPLTIGKAEDDHLFLAPKGGLVRHRVFWPIWVRARNAAGLPKLRIHDLRHSHAAWLISSNIRGGLTTVQRRLGHSSYQVTSDLYGHLMPSVDTDVLAVLDLALPKIGDRSQVGESAAMVLQRTTTADNVPAGPTT